MAERGTPEDGPARPGSGDESGIDTPVLARFTVGPFAENVYVVGVPPRVAIVDPGGESERILERIAAEGWEPEVILLTHGHLDHVAHCAPVAEAYGIDLWMHPADRPMLATPQMPQFAEMLGWSRPPEPARLLEDGETIEVAGLTLDVLHAPGHSPGSVCFVHRPSRHIVVGDVVFHRGVGRTDLPGGDGATLFSSIRDRLFALDGDWVLHPGHGPATTMDEERRDNPFVGERAGARRF